MVKPDTYLLRYGELALKGRNRNRFVDDLIRIIKPRISSLDGKIEKQHKKLLVHCDAEPERVKQALATVFGLRSVSPVWKTSLNMDEIIEMAWLLVSPHLGSGKTFGVRAKRAGKHFELDSVEIQRRVASALFQRGLDLPVKLKAPELPLNISIAFTHAWVYLESWPGLGGLPVDRRTKHGLLISGGIDSPVAGHLIQKRGGNLDAIYFHTPPFTVEAAKEKVIDLCSVLARYQNGLDLHVFNFTEIMKALRAECNPSYLVILQRRLMMRAACTLMNRLRGHSLVTGESLGQVASQTIENIAAVNEGVSLPILRPLIGMDKLEIIAISKAIQAYGISIRPFQDCCSMFAPKDPVTRARLEAVHRQESKVDTEDMLQSALEMIETIHIE